MNGLKSVSLRKLMVVLGMASGLIVACSSPEAKQKEVKIDQAKKDSIALLYDPADADPRIDEFMQRLHKRAAFNGNVLVAKGGKLFMRTLLVGLITSIKTVWISIPNSSWHRCQNR